MGVNHGALVDQVGQDRLDHYVAQYGDGNFNARGRGMFQGINCVSGELASDISLRAFKKGLMIETSGAEDQVIKLLCPLTISDEALNKGLDMIEESISESCEHFRRIPSEKDFFQHA